MKILYTSPTCAFCHMVMDYAKENGIELDVRDITEGENMQALLARGGKMQVPFFVDEEADTHMYESQDIIAYLGDHK